MVLLIIIPIKWLFHWEYTQHFQTNPDFQLGLSENRKKKQFQWTLERSEPIFGNAFQDSSLAPTSLGSTYSRLRLGMEAIWRFNVWHHLKRQPDSLSLHVLSSQTSFGGSILMELSPKSSKSTILGQPMINYDKMGIPHFKNHHSGDFACPGTGPIVQKPCQADPLPFFRLPAQRRRSDGLKGGPVTPGAFRPGTQTASPIIATKGQPRDNQGKTKGKI